jgi:hypothetical protein
MITSSIALLLSSLVCAQDPPDDPAPPATRRAVDLSGLRAALEPAADWFVTWTPLSERWSSPEDALDEPRLANWLEEPRHAERFLPLDLERLAASAAEGPIELELSHRGADYTLLADEAGSQEFERTVRLVERWASRRWNIELIDLAPAAASALDSAVLTAGEVDALLALREPRAARARIATPRRAARFEELRRQSYIGDCDIDYIDSGFAPEPVIDIARWGRDTHVRVHSRSRSSAFVDVETWGGEPDGTTRHVRPYLDRALEIELPSGSLFQTSGSGVVPDGGALVLAPSGSDGGTLLVRVTRIDEELAEADGVELGLGGFPGVRWMMPAYRLPGPVPSGGENVHRDSFYGLDDEETRQMPIDRFDPVDLLATVREDWAERGLRGALAQLGGEVLAVGEPKALKLLEEQVRIASYQGERTFTFELRFGEVPADATRGLVVGTAVPTAVLGRLVAELATGARFIGAAAAGGGVLWTNARESQCLYDLDIELGMGGITLPDPVITRISSGSSAACRVRPLHGDRLLVSMELRRRVLREPVRRALDVVAPTAVLGSPDPIVAELDLPEADNLDLALNVSVLPATWTVLELATRGGRADVVLLRVTEEPLP